MKYYQIKRTYGYFPPTSDWWSNAGQGFLPTRKEGSRMSYRKAKALLLYLRREVAICIHDGPCKEICGAERLELVKWGK